MGEDHGPHVGRRRRLGQAGGQPAHQPGGEGVAVGRGVEGEGHDPRSTSDSTSSVSVIHRDSGTTAPPAATIGARPVRRCVARAPRGRHGRPCTPDRVPRGMIGTHDRRPGHRPARPLPEEDKAHGWLVPGAAAPAGPRPPRQPPGFDEPHVVVALPSFSIGDSLLAHYAERLPALEHRYLLASLMLPRIPGCELVVVSSEAPSVEVIEYHLALMPAATRRRAIRLTPSGCPTPATGRWR